MKTAHQNVPAPQNPVDVANKEYVDAVAGTSASILIFGGSTPGSAPAESVELEYGDLFDQLWTPTDGKGYIVWVMAVARGLVSGNPSVQGFRQMFSVRRDSNITTIASSGVLEQVGDAASSSWTLVASAGSGPDRFRLIFSTGATTSAVNVIAKLEFSEA
jgi:hypothetical protein